jgi:hypothetical protein
MWSATYLGPTLLVFNVNIYYHWEPLLGIAVLLALLVESAGPKPTWLIGVPLIILIGTSGFISNQSPSYHWSFISGRTQFLKTAVIERYRNVPLTSITFVAEAGQLPFWKYSLADPMVQRLTGHPDLQVRYAPYADVSARRLNVDLTNLVVDAEREFIPIQTDDYPIKAISDPPVLLSVSPQTTSAGQVFNLQPNGVAAISIECTNATPQSILLWNGTPLPTFYGNSVSLTALVPKELYAAPGSYEISIATDRGESNKIRFLVRP